MKSFLDSKKADVSIVLLVFMVVVLCGASLFIFLISNNSSQKQILNVGFVSEAYSEGAVFEYYLYNLARTIFIENPNLNAEQFTSEFKKQYAWNSKGEYNQESYWQQIVNNQYEVQINNNQLKFLLKDFRFSKTFENFKVFGIKDISYQKDIYFEIEHE